MCTFLIACPGILASWYLEFYPVLKNYCCVSKTCINVQRILQRVKWKVTAGQRRVATVSRTFQLLLGWHPCPFPPCHTAGHALLNVQSTSPQSPNIPPSLSISHVSCWCLLLDRIYSGRSYRDLSLVFSFWFFMLVSHCCLFGWIETWFIHFPLAGISLSSISDWNICLSILSFILKWLFLIYKCCIAC